MVSVNRKQLLTVLDHIQLQEMTNSLSFTESFDYWEQRDPLIRFRNYLTEKELWTEEKEELIERFKKKSKQQKRSNG